MPRLNAWEDVPIPPGRFSETLYSLISCENFDDEIWKTRVADEDCDDPRKCQSQWAAHNREPDVAQMQARVSVTGTREFLRDISVITAFFGSKAIEERDPSH